MSFILQPWQLLLLIMAGWVHRQQQQAIDYLRTENQVLREKLGKRRILLDDDQRRRLAVKAKVLGRKALMELRSSRPTRSCPFSNPSRQLRRPDLSRDSPCPTPPSTTFSSIKTIVRVF